MASVSLKKADVPVSNKKFHKKQLGENILSDSMMFGRDFFHFEGFTMFCARRFDKLWASSAKHNGIVRDEGNLG